MRLTEIIGVSAAGTLQPCCRRTRRRRTLENERPVPRSMPPDAVMGSASQRASALSDAPHNPSCSKEDMDMRTNFDLTPFRRSTVGFDRLFDLLENGASGADNYPPFDLERISEDGYRITLAVAGFRPEEIDITAQQNLLIVSGRKSGDGQGQYIHRGIATR